MIEPTAALADAHAAQVHQHLSDCAEALANHDLMPWRAVTWAHQPMEVLHRRYTLLRAQLHSPALLYQDCIQW